MHRLKQSFKHERSFRLSENISKRVSKKCRRCNPNQKQRLPRQQERACNNQKPRRTESAATASRIENSKNAAGWPMKSPSSVKAFTVATAPPFCVEVGRITELRGRLLLMKLHGSGRILLVWVSSVAGLLRSGKVSPVSGSTTPANG